MVLYTQAIASLFSDFIGTFVKGLKLKAILVLVLIVLFFMIFGV